MMRISRDNDELSYNFLVISEGFLSELPGNRGKIHGKTQEAPDSKQSEGKEKKQHQYKQEGILHRPRQRLISKP